MYPPVHAQLPVWLVQSPHLPHIPPASLQGIKASEKDGVLKLTVPKSPEAQPKSIDISVASE